jgi:hypothetical protein
MQLKKRVFLFMALLAGAIVAANLTKTNADNALQAPEPTTATLKPVADGPDYLRLEQVHPEVIARFLLTCYDGRMYWNAGIVTTPELSTAKLKKATKNYLEIDSEQILIAQDDSDAKAVDSTLWILRPLNSAQVTTLKNAQTLGAWTEDGSNIRWGAYMHIDNVRGEINQYIEECK